ncbi:hypothetical protein CSUI_008085, partial [Cystoisospora suis]
YAYVNISVRALCVHRYRDTVMCKGIIRGGFLYISCMRSKAKAFRQTFFLAEVQETVCSISVNTRPQLFSALARGRERTSYT